MSDPHARSIRHLLRQAIARMPELVERDPQLALEIHHLVMETHIKALQAANERLREEVLSVRHESAGLRVRIVELESLLGVPND